MGFLALMPNGKSILDPREEKSCPPPRVVTLRNIERVHKTHTQQSKPLRYSGRTPVDTQDARHFAAWTRSHTSDNLARVTAQRHF